MKNGIVILNYNDSENTSLFLDDIKNYKCLDHIIIVDNHSTDNSVEKLKPYENKKIEILTALENKGYAAGNNYGIKYLIEKYNVDNIIISNPDIIIKEEDLEKLLITLKEKNVSVIAPVIHEPASISRGWKQPNFISLLVSNIPYFRKFEQNILSYKDTHYETKLSGVDVVKGCFFIIKSSVMQDINYFDENTFLYYEENIMAKKLKDKNYKTYIHNQVNVIHALSKSINKSLINLDKFKYLKRSQHYYEKYILKLNIFKLLILRLTYYIYYTFACLLSLIRR